MYKLPEGNRPAVYILTGPDPDGTDRPAVYIGECNSLVDRFRSKHHALERAEWTEIYVATTTDGILNKAHALFAEDLLRKRVESAGLATDLTERSAPPPLDAGDQAFSTAFVDDVSLLAKVLGLDVFLARGRQQRAKPDTAAIIATATLDAAAPIVSEADSPIFEYSAKGATGLMQPSGNEFVLLAGSTLAKDEAPRVPAKASRVRSEGLASGLIKDNGGSTLDVLKNVPLGSVSLAAAVVSGNAVAGPSAWTRQGHTETYGQWANRRNSPPSPPTSSDGEDPDAPAT